MAIRAIVFDLYGTLLDIYDPRRPYRKLLAARAGNPKEVILTHDFVNIGAICEKLNLYLTPTEIGEIKIGIARDLDSVTMFFGVPETLYRLRSQGFRLGVISNLATPYKEPFSRLGLCNLVDEYAFSCDVGFAKPDPRIFALMAERLGFDPGEILMVGDSPTSDVAGAREAGFQAILLDRKNIHTDSDKIGSLDELKKLLTERS